MRISVYLPLLLGMALAAGAPLLSARLAPAAAARTLTVLAAVSALCSTWGLLLLTLTLLTETPVAAEAGATGSPVPALVAVVAAVGLGMAASRAGRVVLVRHRAEAAMRGVCRLCSPQGELAVVDDAAPQAFAVPGRPGRILVSTGLLRATTAAQRRVVLAHERAHLRHSHHLYRAVTDVAAAVNPLLIPARRATAFLVERWADEAAANAGAGRYETARVLATVALLGVAPGAASPVHAARLPPAALAFHRHAVLARVQALQAPAPRPAPALAYLFALPALVAAVATADATVALAQVLSPLLEQLPG